MRTQLCLGLAAVAVHVPVERWGEGGVVRWFALKFSPLPPDLALPCMLELLTVLPQVGGWVELASTVQGGLEAEEKRRTWRER